MHYMGGKHRLAGRIVARMQPDIATAVGYWEPFVGAGSVMAAVRHPKRFASDACEPLIALWRHLQAGGTLPEQVSEADYAAAARGEGPPWQQAFIGFGCSFSGKWFGGYARGGHGADAATARRSLLRKMAAMHDVQWLAGDYESFALPRDFVIYCDPPYAGTTSFKGAQPWDPIRFWAWAKVAAQENAVFVSEYGAPLGTRVVASWPHRVEMRNSKNERAERLEQLFQVAA